MNSCLFTVLKHKLLPAYFLHERVWVRSAATLNPSPPPSLSPDLRDDLVRQSVQLNKKLQQAVDLLKQLAPKGASMDAFETRDPDITVLGAVVLIHYKALERELCSHKQVYTRGSLFACIPTGELPCCCVHVTPCVHFCGTPFAGACVCHFLLHKM